MIICGAKHSKKISINGRPEDVLYLLRAQAFMRQVPGACVHHLWRQKGMKLELYESRRSVG